MNLKLESCSNCECWEEFGICGNINSKNWGEEVAPDDHCEWWEENIRED